MLREKLIDFIKGIIIGIGNIMPGFSGGVMAVSFNVYDRIIGAISRFFKEPIKVIKDLWAIALGGVIGIGVSLVGINLLLKYFPVPTIMLFSGLIVGSIPTIFEKVKAKSYKNYQIIAFMIGAALIVLLPIITKERVVLIEEVNLKVYLIMFFLGLISATTMIVPGVSGSLILLAFGYYQYIVDFIIEFMKSIISFNFEGIVANLGLVISLGLGIVVGIVGLAKVMEYLLAKYPKLIYSLILGLVTASPFAIIYQMYNDNTELIQANLIINIIAGIIALAIGVFLADYMTKFEKNHPSLSKEIENEQNQEI